MFLKQLILNLVWWWILLKPTFWYLSMWPGPWFKVTWMQERRNFCGCYLPKLWMDVDGILHAAETYGRDQFSTSSVSSYQYSTLSDFVKNLSLACIWTFADRFLSSLLWWWTPLNCIVWYQCEWPWPSLKVTEIWKKWNFCCLFLANFSMVFWMKSSMLSWYAAMTCWSLQAQTHSFCMVYSQGRELNFSDFKENMLMVGLRSDAYEPVCFKHGMMIDMIRLCMLIPAWMTLIFTQGYRVLRKLELVQSFCCNVAWSSPNICTGLIM